LTILDPYQASRIEVARQSELNREELEILEQREMFLHDNRNAIRKAAQDAEARGEARGRAEGERQAKIAIARSLLNVLPIETISQTTGLSLSEIESLTQKLS
jgi:predicted transposase/invertase (TIGR01784 family)